MKEAFEKLKERLEEKAEKLEISRRYMLRTEGDSKDYCYFNGMVEGLIESQRILSEVEAEYINKSTEHINKSSDCSTNWIPCGERMPEDFQSVLCYAESIARSPDTIFVGSQKHGCWFLQSSIGTESFPTQYKVIAWRPLPEPYKPEKGEKN